MSANSQYENDREQEAVYRYAERESASDGLTNLCRHKWCILCSSDDCACPCHEEKEIWP
jgi:hypothetical protein